MGASRSHTHRREENGDNFKSHRSTGTVLDYRTKVIKLGVCRFPPKNGTNCVPGEIYFFPGQPVRKENTTGKNGTGGNTKSTV